MSRRNHRKSVHRMVRREARFIRRDLVREDFCCPDCTQSTAYMLAQRLAHVAQRYQRKGLL